MRKPYKKITWNIATGIYGALDAVQELMDLGLTEFFGAPEGINDFILDPLIGISQAIFFWYGGVLSSKNCLVLIITFLTEEATFGGAPFWFLDVIYAQRNAPPTEEEQGRVIAGSYTAINNANNAANLGYDPEGPLHQNVGGQNIRIPDNANQQPLNIKENGVSARPPRV